MAPDPENAGSVPPPFAICANCGTGYRGWDPQCPECTASWWGHVQAHHHPEKLCPKKVHVFCNGKRLWACAAFDQQAGWAVCYELVDDDPNRTSLHGAAVVRDPDTGKAKAYLVTGAIEVVDPLDKSDG